MPTPSTPEDASDLLADPTPTGRVQAIDRAFVLLRELAQTPQGATALELAKRAGIERSTVHRLLKTLQHWEMVHTDNGVYSIGPESLLYATAHVNRLNVRRAALPYAVELQEKVLHGKPALVSISAPARDQVIIVERIWTPLTPMNVIIDIGNHFPIEASASGRSILSTYTEQRCLTTIGERRYAKVVDDLDVVRKADGFSTSQGRFKAGLDSLSYPIRGRDLVAVGAMVISGLDLGESLNAASPLAQHLRRACQNISSNLQAR